MRAKAVRSSGGLPRPLPELLSGRRIERVDGVVRDVGGGADHHAVVDQWEALLLPELTEGLHPLDLQLLDVPRVDLAERAVAPAVLGPVVLEPVVRVPGSVQETLIGHRGPLDGILGGGTI